MHIQFRRRATAALAVAGLATGLATAPAAAMSPTQVQSEAAESSAASDTAAPDTASADLDGAEIYENMGCAGCHGAEGGGGRGPALNGSLAVRDTPVLLRQILHGSSGMPPFGDALTDEEVAALARFLRDEWGGRLPLPEVTLEEIATARTAQN